LSLFIGLSHQNLVPSSLHPHACHMWNTAKLLDRLPHRVCFQVTSSVVSVAVKYGGVQTRKT
jgi:hypothetical protein